MIIDWRPKAAIVAGRDMSRLFPWSISICIGEMERGRPGFLSRWAFSVYLGGEYLPVIVRQYGYHNVQRDLHRNEFEAWRWTGRHWRVIEWRWTMLFAINIGSWTWRWHGFYINFVDKGAKGMLARFY